MKKLTTILAIVLIGIFAAYGVTSLSVDRIVRTAIEEKGTDLLDTKVTIDDVDISLLNGSGSISGFKIMNPDDFSNRSAFHFEEVSMDLKPISLFTSKVEVENITLNEPEIYFEQKGFGVNLSQLRQNMEIESDQESNKTVIIDTLMVNSGSVIVNTTVDRERQVTVDLEKIMVYNIGKDNARTTQQVLKDILDPIIKEAIEQAATQGVMDQVENQVKDLLGG